MFDPLIVVQTFGVTGLVAVAVGLVAVAAGLLWGAFTVLRQGLRTGLAGAWRHLPEAVPHAVLVELFTDEGVGTLIRRR